MNSSYLKTSPENELLTSYKQYAEARQQFLTQLKLPNSCRDPLAEFCEQLVGHLLNAQIAPSRVQKGYDLISSQHRRIQVKYLANATLPWVNGHLIHFTNDIDDFALVIFQSLQIEAILIFPRESLIDVCLKLKKRHPRQATELQLTRANYLALLQQKEHFAQLGVRVIQFDQGGNPIK